MNTIKWLGILIFIPIILYAQIDWTPDTIEVGFPTSPSGLYTTDLDLDGNNDVLVTGWNGGIICWWKNDGNGNFIRDTIATNFPTGMYVSAIDLDDDLDIDVIGTQSTGLSWFENDGNQNFAKHSISNISYGHALAIDLDDGDIDVVCGGDNGLNWYENDGNENFTEKIIKTDAGSRMQTPYVIDLDNDGDKDILVASYLYDYLSWYENDGDENFTEHIIKSDYDGAWSVYAINLDNDGDLDVLASGINAIIWFENDGNQNFTEDTIDNGNYISGIDVADIDKDNDYDIVGTGNGEISWYENDGYADFTKHNIGNWYMVGEVSVIDMDNDSDDDVVYLSGFAPGIYFYKSDLARMHDVATFSIDIPDTVLQDTLINPKATVKNLGMNTETFDVVCKINPGAYINTETVISLDPDSIYQVEFDTGFTFANGPYTIIVYTYLTGDEKTSNDTLVKVVQTHDPGIEEGNVEPKAFSFGSKSNPTKGKALFNLALPQDGLITLRIYDVSGRLIDRVISGRKSAGYYQISWIAPNNAGVYFYTFESPGHRENGKLVLIH